MRLDNALRAIAKTVSQLRLDAKESAARALSVKVSTGTIVSIAEKKFQDAMLAEDHGLLRDAFFKYQQGASLLAHAIGLPDVKNSRSDISKLVTALQEQLANEYIPRFSAIEAKLKESDVLQDRQSLPPVNNAHAEPELKPGASISDRLRSLQGAGMVVNVPKRFSKDLASTPVSINHMGSYLPTPPKVAPTSHTTNGNSPPQPTSSYREPPWHTSTSLEDNAHLRSLEGNEPLGMPTLYQISTELQESLDQPTTTGENVSESANAVSIFSQSFPSIDELDAQGSWVLPALDSHGMPAESSTSGSRQLSSDTSSGAKSASRLSLPELPAVSSIFPHTAIEWAKGGYSLLLLDVRTRSQFDDEHPRHDALVCLEPSILVRSNITSDQIESALVISPTSEQTLFGNRDKFDAVIIMDQSSSSISGSASPLPALIRAIYENEFKKTLKRPPVLLVGGMDAWKQELGDKSVVSRAVSITATRSDASTNVEPVDIQGKPGSGDHLPRIGPTTRAYPQPSTTENVHPPVASRPVSSPSHIQYPKPTVARTSSTGSFRPFSDGLRSPASKKLATTPSSVIIASPASGRQRTDSLYHWESSPFVNSTTRPSIDYPVLSPQTVLPQPPAAAVSVLDRQAHRSGSSHQAQSYTNPAPKPSPLLIASNYPVSTWGDVEIGTSGLKNLGNTCYMNSTLQCLSATAPFVRFFQDGRWKTAVNMMNPLGTQGHLAQGFSSIIQEMWRREYTYISPLTFRRGICQRAPQFSGSNQHDSQEFLSFLLDGLHEDLNRVLQKPPPQVVTGEREAELERLPQQVASSQEWDIYRMRNDSLIVDYFQGQFRNRLQCLTCRQTSTTYNAFMYLSLPLPTNRVTTRTSLYQCLDAFVADEIMENEDAWNCPHCKTLRRATKQLSLSRLPPVLLIHLKRFSFDGPFTDKLETPVDYPVHGLDLTGYIPSPLPSDSISPLPTTDPRRQDPPFKYDLYGVTNHFGTLSSGHYTAFIASKGNWLLCDDSRVIPAEESAVVARSAYVLYYKRVLRQQ